MPRFLVQVLVLLLALALVIILGAICLSCATTSYSETAKDPDGTTRTTLYSARKFNVFGATEQQSESFRSTIEQDGASSVETGQAIQGMDNTGSQEVVIQMLNLLIPYLFPPVPEPVPEILEE